MIKDVFVENPGWILFLVIGLVTIFGLGFSVVKEAKRVLPSEAEVDQMLPLLFRRSLILSMLLSLLAAGWIWMPANSARVIWTGGEFLTTIAFGSMISALVWIPGAFALAHYLKRKRRGLGA